MKQLYLFRLVLIVFVLSACGAKQDQSYEGKKRQVKDVTFCAVGDILLDRGVRTVIEKEGVNYPFEKVTDFINTFDLAFCNLECPLSSRGDPLDKKFVFRADSSFIEGLVYSGFNVYSLANNHILDYGRQALIDTRNHLESRGFHTIGYGDNQDEASRARIIEINGMRFAFLAFVLRPLKGIEYSENLPGPAHTDLDGIIAELTKVENEADFTIVSFHWGQEYYPYPSIEQREYAYSSIDAGADLILGHHPHVLQGIEKYSGKFIFYSLGNFVFDQSKLKCRQSMILVCSFKKKQLSSLHIVPVIIENCQPYFAQGEDFEGILRRITKISESSLVHFRLSEDGDYVIIE